MADIATIVLRNYLEECTLGDEVYYKSTAWANFDGCFIELRGNNLKCSCSICKLYSKSKSGKLDNSRPITFAMAVRTIRDLLMRLCVREENAVVTYYEVGITMKMSHPADCYIRQMEKGLERVLWNDANYPEYRQKTTEKSKYFRKVLKVYDKTYEAAEKGRRTGDNILRIETIYKRQAVRMQELLDNSFLLKLGRIFYRDWSGIRFVRDISPAKGAKISQIDKAREILRIGVTRYKERYRQMYQDGKLTKKQWETIRTFASNWTRERGKYTEIIGDLELEFKQKLDAGYQIGIITPFRKNI